MNETNVKNEPIDGLLTEYFQSEMPKPWPAWRAPETNGALPSRRSRWWTFSRLAVAASVVALLAGYLALAGFFPRETDGRFPRNPARDIGHHNGVKAAQPNQ